MKSEIIYFFYFIFLRNVFFFKIRNLVWMWILFNDDSIINNKECLNFNNILDNIISDNKSI